MFIPHNWIFTVRFLQIFPWQLFLDNLSSYDYGYGYIRHQFLTSLAIVLNRRINVTARNEVEKKSKVTLTSYGLNILFQSQQSLSYWTWCNLHFESHLRLVVCVV